MPKTTQFERNKKGIFTPTEVTPRIWNLSHIVMVSRRSGSPKMILQSSNWKLSLRIRKKNPTNIWHRTPKIHLTLQMNKLLLTEASSKMVSVWGWQSRNHSYGRKKQREERLSYAILHKTHTENQWQQVRNNESKFDIFGPNYCLYVWGRSGIL